MKYRIEAVRMMEQTAQFDVEAADKEDARDVAEAMMEADEVHWVDKCVEEDVIEDISETD